MIYCNVVGGLGNIMFQVAALASMASDKNLGYSIPNLNAHLNFLSNSGFRKYASEYNVLFSKLMTTAPIENLPIITYPFDYKDIPTPEDNFFINGFFQSEKYFVHNKKLILDLFDPQEDIVENLKKKYPVIFDNKTTSVHIRRGDYLDYPNFHPTQSQEYYRNCIEHLSSDTDFFIFFSDDTTWCKNHFKEQNFLFIENEKDYLSLLLMSFCSNNIISNSSFSWWGAWLNKNNYKKVIGPKIWFGPGLNYNTNDIIPENWTKI